MSAVGGKADIVQDHVEANLRAVAVSDGIPDGPAIAARTVVY